MTRLRMENPVFGRGATQRLVMRRAVFGLAIAALAVLAGCATPTPPPPRSLTAETPEAMVAAIRAAAGRDDAELAVQPLRDPEVEDLREQALALEARHRDPEAAAALDKALALVPEDPALLQERAEAVGAARERFGSGGVIQQQCRFGAFL
jgi:hypothetical protein